MNNIEKKVEISNLDLLKVEELEVAESMSWWETALAVVGVVAVGGAGVYVGYVVTGAIIAT